MKEIENLLKDIKNNQLMDLQAKRLQHMELIKAIRSIKSQV